jgi:hypothetical protein
MKCGVEVEGVSLGTKTMFCQFAELNRLMSFGMTEKIQELCVEQIYISDHKDEVTQHIVDRVRAMYPECFITIETHGMPKVKVDPATARYMIAYPTADVERFNELSSLDQIKFTHGHNVLTISGRFDLKTSSASLHFTVPKDFEGDIVL